MVSMRLVGVVVAVLMVSVAQGLETAQIPDYNRAQWKHWTDADKDCRDTRQEVLVRDSRVPVTFDAKKCAGSGAKRHCDCVVTAGQWLDPYSGQTLTDPKLLDVDHMVPLENAHRSGGWQWDAQRRQDYANRLTEPEHLLAVSATLNRQKGSKGPEAWWPPLAAYRCTYATHWLAIKARWKLTLTVEEAIAAVSEEGGGACP